MRAMGPPKKIVWVFQLIVSLFTFAAAAEIETSTWQPERIFSNFTVYLSFLDDVFYHLSTSAQVSKNCNVDTQTLLDKAKSGDENALKIFDSTGKPSSGVLTGGVSFIGYYSECIQSVIKIKAKSFTGKYCLLNVNFTNQEENIPRASWLVLNQRSPNFGICIPSSCSTSDLENATNLSLGDIFEYASGKVSVCHGDISGFSKDAGAICVLCVFLIFTILAISATTVDYVTENKKLPPCQDISTIDYSKSVSQEILFKVEDPNFKKSSVPLDCLLAFSFKRNASKIFTVEDKGENIRCVHGLKFLSMALIILGHTYSFAMQNLFIRNPAAANKAPANFVSQIFANGTFAVDTFYLISGILVAFVTLKVLDKTGGKLPILYFYFHRYFRLTPLLMAVIAFSAYLLRYLGSGPNWLNSIEMYDEWCKDNGWLNALYLHNFINTENMCLGHTWYLATDMQIYLIVPLILIPLHRSFKLGLGSMLVFLLISILSTAIITAVNHYPAIPYINNVLPIEIVNMYYKYVYIKPYCRMGPYIVGIAVGYYLLNNKELILKKTTVVLLWTSSIALGLAIIYLMWPANKGILPTNAEAAAYSALARTTWAISLAWLVIACFYGYGGVINKILSSSVLVPFSRLTYCAYLIHPVIMNGYYGSTEIVVDFTMSYMMYLFLGNICITFVVSIFLSLLFESPFVSLEKVILSKKSS